MNPSDTLAMPVDERTGDEIESRLALSYLVADVGHALTSATLYESVSGGYRFVSRGLALTTAKPPWSDVNVGLRNAIDQIARTTGRSLLSSRGDLIRPSRADGSGIDRFGAVVSAAEPLRVIIVGLWDEMSIASARRALRTVYAREVDCIGLEDKRSKTGQVNSIISKEPDVILIVGGLDGSEDKHLLSYIETVSIALSLMDDSAHPEIIFAGNVTLRTEVNKLLADLAQPQYVENIRPEPEIERLDQVIGKLSESYLRRKLGILPGIGQVIDWAMFPLSLTAHTFGGIGEFFAAHYKKPVLCLDIDVNQVSFVLAMPDEVELFIRTDLGLGQPLLKFATENENAGIRQWLPADVNASEVENYILSKACHPLAMPQTDIERQLEHAILRQVIRNAVQGALKELDRSALTDFPPIRRIFIRGTSFSNAPSSGSMLLTLLDGLQPHGIFSISLDRFNILPSMGLLAADDPELVIQVLSRAVLEELGWVIAPAGTGKPGQTAMKLTLSSASGETSVHEVAFGSVEIIPLAADQRARLTINPMASLDVGFGMGKAGSVTVSGGSVGLMIDARGRPLNLESSAEKRTDQIQKWTWAVGG